MNNQGWIKIHRKLLDWEWFEDNNTFKLFMYLLLKVNHENAKWRGVEIKRGETITSIEALAKSTTLTFQQVRTSLTKLKSTGEITIKTTNKYTLIELVKYGVYQIGDDENNKQDNKQDNKQITNKQQTNNKQITTNNKEKNKENENNEKKVKEKIIKKEYGEFKNVLLSDDEFEKLIVVYKGDHDLHKAIDILDEWIGKVPSKIKERKFDRDHYLTICKTNGWVYKKVYETENKGGRQNDPTLSKDDITKKTLTEMMGEKC